MSTEHNYYNKAIAFDSLYAALKKCCRNVRWKDSVVGYENNGIKNTLNLHKSLVNNTYIIDKYQCFKIYEPKERTILAARIKDRQFQRSLCDNGLYEDITEHLIRDNFACQIGRGTDDALKRTKVHLRKYYNKHGYHGWVLKCDIHHFFPETRHDVAKAAVNKYVSDRQAAQAVCNIIDSFNGEKGIGLGSQVSQLVELIVLNELDHLIKEKWHIKHYFRYMDDFVLIHPDKEYLKTCLCRIRQYLSTIGFKLNKTGHLFPLSQGFYFLKWYFKITPFGKILMLIHDNKLSHQRQKMRKMWIKESLCFRVKDSFQSFLSNLDRGNTYNAQKIMKQFYYDLTGGRYEPNLSQA